MALRLQHLGWVQDLTEGQEKLWRQLIAELVWRSARKRRICDRCWCDLCQPDVDGAELEGPAPSTNMRETG